MNANEISVTIIPIILFSDKTHLSSSGKAKAWPVHMSIGNISYDVRWSQKLQSSRLIALLPRKSGNARHAFLSTDSCAIGPERHEQSDEYREWFRNSIHMILEHVMEPLKLAMNDGIYLKCADGETRFCFPILCQYLADYEEQVLLTNLIRGACPKCVGVRGQLEAFRRLDHREPAASWIGGAAPRLDKDAHRLRNKFTEGKMTLEQLESKRHSYHPSDTFSAHYPFGGILDALGPDLLHQVSKCFMDYVMKQWLKPLIVRHWKEKGVKKKTILREIDKRFMYVTAYPKLRRFSSGVFAEDHHWTMREYKDIMRVTPAVLHGICPPEGMDLLREYLHIHLLSHYTAHTDVSLELLDSAIHSFWRILKDPNGRFVQWKIWNKNDNFAQPRLHYLSHYTQAVREKGCLPGCSTDRTEPLHKHLKEYYRKSNKGAEYDLFLLKSESKLAGFDNMIYKLEGSIPWQRHSKRQALSDAAQLDQEGIRMAKISKVHHVQDESEDKDELDDDDEFEGLELRPPKPQYQAALRAPTSSVSWPCKCRHSWPTTIQNTITKLACDGFLNALHSFLAKSSTLYRAFRDISKDDLGLLPIGVMNFIKRKYVVNAVYGADISGTFAASWEIISKVDVISAGPETGRRRDCVLVKCSDSGKSRARERNSMTNRKVARVRFFFKFKEDLKRNWAPGYAYIQWFSTMGPVDPRSGMYTVKCTNKFEVIDVNRIEYGVHLIPKFGNTLSASSKDVPIGPFGPQVFDHFEEFFLNTWIDIYQYNDVF
jgi:Plavaka transposase